MLDWALVSDLFASCSETFAAATWPTRLSFSVTAGGCLGALRDGVNRVGSSVGSLIPAPTRAEYLETRRIDVVGQTSDVEQNVMRRRNASSSCDAADRVQRRVVTCISQQ